MSHRRKQKDLQKHESLEGWKVELVEELEGKDALEKKLKELLSEQPSEILYVEGGKK